ncbi:methyltransferase domain-containing protein [Acinetobacter sp. ANC 4636]
MNSEQYANEWSKNSNFFDANNHYNWMNESLGEARLVLEIGCGSGYSTLSLLKTNRKVLVIETNQNCINEAIQKVTAQGINFFHTCSINDAYDCLHDEAKKVIFLQMDFFEFIQQINDVVKFNAIVCWLIGAAPEVIAKNLNKDFSSFEGNTMALYRIKLHKACYELGTRVLNTGGIVHIIDRNIIRSWNDKDWARNEAIRDYSELSGEHYDITLPNVYLRKSGQFKTSQIQYVAVSDQPPPSEGLQVICSVKSVRR